MDVPEENCEYPVVLGRSLVPNEEPEAEREEAHTDAAYALFQYKFTPASVDATVPGLVSVDESHGVTVLRGSAASGVDGGITFKGKIVEQKDTECLLIFDGTSFRLERCDYVVSQLRHVRAAPLQRPPPSAFPAPTGKKSFRLGSTKRLGKAGKKGTMTSTAINDAMQASHQMTSDARDPSVNLSSADPSSAPATTNSVPSDGDRDADDEIPKKHRRQGD